MKLDPKEFLAAKAELDKILASADKLAALAKKRSLECCSAGLLDARDDLGEISSLLRRGQAALEMARVVAGRMDTGGITRSGGT